MLAARELILSKKSDVVRVYVPAGARSHVLRWLHRSSVAGHPRTRKTLKAISTKYVSPNMEKDVHGHVPICVKCQQNKARYTKAPGLLQPLSIPGRPCQCVSVDFVNGLPASGAQAHDSIYHFSSSTGCLKRPTFSRCTCRLRRNNSLSCLFTVRCACKSPKSTVPDRDP